MAAMATWDPRANDIFLSALELRSAGERREYLGAACAGDAALQAEVEALLRADAEAGSFLEAPARAAQLAATASGSGPVDPRLAEVVEEYRAGLRAGRCPDRQGLYARYPDLAGALAECLDAIELVEGAAPVGERPGAVIGPYKLMEQIGEGGMGLVFVAVQQHPVRRKVALKVIKPGMDSRQVVARFEAERQALALMDHPNIAKVHDGGTTPTGRPYFVMELVKGVPITDYCDQNQVPIRARLDLFLHVCQAVQHAHQKGIIHRDIKPSNVLVMSNDGTPLVKVIDFGVAKAVGHQLTDKTIYTQFAQLVGTPLYMSPEQAGQSGVDVDTRSDIYSLGVVLYELLTGTTPFDKARLRTATFEEIRRIIREEEPGRPSTRISSIGQTAATVSANRRSDPRRLSRLFRGELDWIVMKALEKDRNRRYESASAFAADVQRYLNDEPVQACPPSAWYKFRKLARRNKAVLATASAVGLAVLLAVGSLVGAVEVLADSNAQIKQEQKQTKEALGAERQAKEDLVRALYFQRIASAQGELEANNVGRAEELLEECPFQLRGWEWHYLKRRRYQTPLTFRGHSAGVIAVAFSPDGKQVASASSVLNNLLGEIKVWDRATGRVLLTLPPAHLGPVVGVAFSPDGKHLASAGWDKTAIVWDAATGKRLHTLSGHSEYLIGVAFSPDGKLLATASGDRTAKLWDTNGFQVLRTLHGHRVGLYGLAFSPDSKRLATASGDRTVRVWDTATGRELHVLEGHAGPALSVAFSPDGKRLASAAGDGTVKLWDPVAGRHLRTIRANVVLTTSVAFSPDGRRLATGDWEKTVKVWDLESDREALTLRGHTDWVTNVTFSPDGLQIASASLDNTVMVWDATPLAARVGAELLTLRGHRDAVAGVAYQPGGKLLATASLDHTVKLWDAATGGEVRTLTGHASPLADVAFSRDGSRLASADIAGVVKVWDPATGREIHSFRGYSVRVALSPDGRRLASALEGAWVYVWDAATGKELLRPFRAHDIPVICLAFSPDGRNLVTGSWDSTARVWDAATGRLLHTLRGHRHIISGVTFSADGQRLATASWDKTAKIWDAATGKELFTLSGHTDRLLSVAFSPDGKRLATGSWENSVKIWDGKGHEIATLRGDEVSCVAFSPDGKRLATAGGYRGMGELKIWDATQWNDDREGR
jgi:WD40 repeat protein/serine/threonine protein kinase